MIPSYVRSHALGCLQLNRHASVMKDAGTVSTLDGNGGFGQVVAHEAMQMGIEKAKQHGMAAVALRNAPHRPHRLLGRTVRRRGMISIHFVNVVGNIMVAPFRGKDSRFGTNPLCVVFPREGHPPLLLDYATSAIAFGKTRVAWHKRRSDTARFIDRRSGRSHHRPGGYADLAARRAVDLCRA